MGREIGMHRDYSEATARDIDDEVKRLVEIAERRAVAIVKKNIKKLKALAVALLEKEILDSKEIDKILGVCINQKTVINTKKRNNEKRKQKGN